MEILVVEDDPAVRAVFTKALAGAGFTVNAVDNGLAALTVLASGKHDFRVIISDLRMPKLDGIGLYQRLRREFPESADRMLFVTASAPDEASFLRMAKRPYLVKPLHLSELLDTVAQLTGPRADRRGESERRQVERRQRAAGIQVDRRARAGDRRELQRRGYAA